MFQKVTIIGNLGGEPDTRFLSNGSSVCSFSVATNRTWTNNDGSKGEQAVWWRISAWGKLGEVCQQYLSKGRQVYIEGEIQADDNGNPRLWTDNEGNPRASYEIRANTVKFLSGSGDDAPRAATRPAAPAARAAAPATTQAATRNEDEFDPNEIPF